MPSKVGYLAANCWVMGGINGRYENVKEYWNSLATRAYKAKKI